MVALALELVPGVCRTGAVMVMASVGCRCGKESFASKQRLAPSGRTLGAGVDRLTVNVSAAEGNTCTVPLLFARWRYFCRSGSVTSIDGCDTDVKIRSISNCGEAQCLKDSTTVEDLLSVESLGVVKKGGAMVNARDRRCRFFGKRGLACLGRVAGV